LRLELFMDEPIPNCIAAIIVLTSICSVIGFQNPAFRDKYLFWVRPVLAGKQYYRLFTSALLHADWNHLLLNMVSLYLVGRHVEFVLGSGRFLLIYLAAILGGSLLSLWVHRHHEYQAYGASGGVCGIVFSSVLLFPDGTMTTFPLPISIPTWLYAILFIVGSFAAFRRQTDNVGHDAHLGGAIIGLWTTAALVPVIVRLHPELFVAISALAIGLFVYLVKNPFHSPFPGFAPRWRWPRWPQFRRERPVIPRHRREARDLDAALEKISRSGIHSLTDEEKALLNSASGKYQRRAESKKPDSGLPF
jgi:membrane associated rhomboid family serine protease